MRPSRLTKLVSFTKYKKLKIDFQTPLRALYASTGASSKAQKLITKSGITIRTNRSDTPLWDEYFYSKNCTVHLSNDLFHVIPHNPAHPDYYIKGCNNCFTYQPRRWCKNSSEFIKAIENSERSEYSQHGEDGVLEYIGEKIGIKHKFIVEFGAHDGITMSNSRYLIKNKGWSGFLIELDARFYNKLNQLYENNSKVKIKQTAVTEENINQLFKSASVPFDFDILSIDIDSYDYYVWKSLIHFEPRIVVIEYNSSIPPGSNYLTSRNNIMRFAGTAKESANIQSFYELGISKGYTLIYGELYGANLFFVHHTCTNNLSAADITLDEIYQPPQFGKLAGGTAPNGRGYSV